jgi:hypothetical protein
MDCRSGTWYYYGYPITIIAIIIQVILAYLTVSMHYRPDFYVGGDNLLEKRCSFPDVIFLFSKILILVIFIFDTQSESEHWPMLSVISFITGLNAYGTLFLQYYENKIIKKLNYFYSLFLFW